MVVKSFLTMNHDPSVPLLNTIEKPLLSRFRDGVLTADFGNAVFGNVRIETRGAPFRLTSLSDSARNAIPRVASTATHLEMSTFAK